MSASKQVVLDIRFSGKREGNNLAENGVGFIEAALRSVCIALLNFASLGLAMEPEGQARDFNREVLRPLASSRQQHRRIVDGRLRAIAFMQNRNAYTGCADATNPIGESGRSWCYVEPQVSDIFLIWIYIVLPSFCSSWAAARPHGTTVVMFFHDCVILHNMFD